MRQPPLGAASGAAIGVLGGLIGLGGGEFRLPVLTSLFGFSTRSAVPMNLLVSFVTLVAALCIRPGALPLLSLLPFAIEMAALDVGGMIGARWSARLLTEGGTMPWSTKKLTAADIAPDRLRPYCKQFLQKLADQGYAPAT